MSGTDRDPPADSVPPEDRGADRPDFVPPPPIIPLLEGLQGGRRIALARAISVVENERDGFQELLHALLVGDFPRDAMRLGVTGPPGAGKSSLVSTLARLARSRNQSVGIVAVDPTSPYSGGALLGDRIRMNELATDEGIFIRSMASRGSLGGLATTTKEVIDVMEAFGFPRIFVETVGVGQAELEITGAADTVAVVLVPESGDGIQAMKAGLMEIADIFVVNKADRPGADRLVREIRAALRLRSGTGTGTGGSAGHHGTAGHHGPRRGRRRGAPMSGEGDEGRREGDEDRRERDEDRSESEWIPPVLVTVAQTGEGVEELLDTVDRHRAWLETSGELERRRRARTTDRIRDVLERELKRRVRKQLEQEPALSDALTRIAAGTATPYSEAARFLQVLGVDATEAPLPDPPISS